MVLAEGSQYSLLKVEQAKMSLDLWKQLLPKRLLTRPSVTVHGTRLEVGPISSAKWIVLVEGKYTAVASISPVSVATSHMAFAPNPLVFLYYFKRMPGSV